MAITGGTFLFASAHNPQGGVVSATQQDDMEFFSLSETITFSGTGATADSTAGLLPANAVILYVLATVTTAITGTTITGCSVGDASTAARFGTTAALTAGSTNVATCWTPLKGSISTDATGPTVGATALAVRLTGTGGGSTVTAGAVRVTVFGLKPRFGAVGVGA